MGVRLDYERLARLLCGGRDPGGGEKAPVRKAA